MTAAIRPHWPSRRSSQLIAAFAICLTLTGCSTLGGKAIDPNNGKTTTTTAATLLSQTFQRTQTTIDAAGGGAWKWDDGTAWTGPDDSTGFFGISCGDGKSAQYTVNITGPAQADPGAAAARVAAAWKKRGWTVRTVFAKQGVGIEIAVDFPAGGGLGYSVSTEGSNIDAQSACSTDPGMLTPAK